MVQGNHIQLYLAPVEFHEKLRRHSKRIEQISDPEDTYISEEVRALHNQARIAWLEEFGDQHLSYRQFIFPTLIFAGDKDLIIPSINSVELAKAIPNSELIRFSEGGHDLCVQFPNEICRLIKNL